MLIKRQHKYYLFLRRWPLDRRFRFKLRAGHAWKSRMMSPHSGRWIGYITSLSIEQIDSMLPCVCSEVIDYRWHRNRVRTKKWHTRRSRVCHWCSYHILTSSVIYYCTDVRQHGIYLFYIITNSLFYSNYFNITRKPAFAPPLPILAKTKKRHLT